MIVGASAELARRLAPDRVSNGDEREITVDRSNDCVVVDESVFVKWLTPPAPLPHRGLEVMQHLREVGFTAMPALLGHQIANGAVEAIVFEHIAGSDDGWTWVFDDVNRALAGERPNPIGPTTDAVGRLAADLHRAMATPSAVFAQPVATVDRRFERERGRALLAQALAEVTADDQPAAHAVLHACRGPLERVIDSIPDGPTPAIHIHGDLHAGQLLKAGDRIAVIDFDGNPLASGTPELRSPAVDVASLVQSIDHCVRMTQHRNPGRDVVLDALATAARRSTLDGYRTRFLAADEPLPFEESLLTPLRAIQELHELVYAVRRLPRWAYAPTYALRAMFAEEIGWNP